MEFIDQLLTFDIVRVGLSAYGDLLAYYRPLFLIAVTMWVLSIAFDLLQHDSLRPPLYKLIRGAVVIAYLTEPSVAYAFAEMLQIPDHTSGVIIGHVTGDHAGPATFSESLQRLLETVTEQTKTLLKKSNDSIIGFNIMPYIIIANVYICLILFLAMVLYIKILAGFFQAALIFLLPLAVTLYPWSYTRPLFDGVIRQGISFSLVSPLLNVLVVMVTSPLIFALKAVDNLYALLPFGILSIAGFLLAWQIPSVASGVAGGIGLPILKPRVPGL